MIWANPQTLDRYVYTADNPVTFTDPTGLMSCGGGSGAYKIANDGTEQCMSLDYWGNELDTVANSGGAQATSRGLAAQATKPAQKQKGKVQQQRPGSSAWLVSGHRSATRGLHALFRRLGPDLDGCTGACAAHSTKNVEVGHPVAFRCSTGSGFCGPGRGRVAVQ